MLRIKRTYDAAARGDGRRILVERLWEPTLDAEKRATVTLLYSAHDVLHNGAVVLRDYLPEGQARRSRRGKREVEDDGRIGGSARRRAR